MIKNTKIMQLESKILELEAELRLTHKRFMLCQKKLKILESKSNKRTYQNMDQDRKKGKISTPNWMRNNVEELRRQNEE